MKKDFNEKSRREVSNEEIEKIYSKKEKEIEGKEEMEKREFFQEKEKMILEKLEEEGVKMRIDPDLEEEAAERAEEIKSLNKKGKISRLLNLAEEKGIPFAVKVALSINDPYTLDIFHDIMARDEFYKRFSGK